MKAILPHRLESLQLYRRWLVVLLRNAHRATIACCAFAATFSLICIAINWFSSAIRNDLWIFAFMVCFPYFVTVIVGALLPEDHWSAVLFCLLIVTVSAVRLFLLGSLTAVASQPVDDDAGDNMIGLLPFIDAFVLVPLQTCLSGCFAVFAVWKGRHT